MRRKPLGRGLDNLIPESAKQVAKSKQAKGDTVLQVPIAECKPNPFQPRKALAPEALAELAASIEANGILQPLVLRKAAEGYEVVAGWRRLKAAEALGMTEVPAIIRQYTDAQAAQLALVENLQRENLNALEQAEAYRRLLDEFKLTQQDLATVLGKSRSAITNTLRLLNLPGPLRNSLAAGEITEGHARALLQLEDSDLQLEAWQRVLKQGLNVRQTEALARKLQQPPQPKPSKDEVKEELLPLKRTLESALQARVDIALKRKGQGYIQIHFPDQEELERLLELLLKASGEDYSL